LSALSDTPTATSREYSTQIRRATEATSMRFPIRLPLLIAVATVSMLAACKSTPRDEAPAVQWTQVADSATQVAYLDPASLQSTKEGLRATVKVNYTTPQAFRGDAYLSSRSTYVMDCSGRRLADRENAIYAGTDLEGKKLSSASRSMSNLIWRDATAGSIDGELLTSACRRAP
jgi:hypothetical protein